jgi:cobalt/nickel transport system permease protein
MCISLSMKAFAAILLISLSGWIAAVAVLRLLIRRRRATTDDPDWSVPPLSFSESRTVFHRWDVRFKIVALISYCFLVAALRNLHPAIAAVGISATAVLVARADLIRVLMRVMAVTGFLGMLLVIMPLTASQHSTDTVVRVSGWPFFSFNLRALTAAGVIGAKALAIALMMEPLLATAPLPVTLHGLSKLGLPDMLGQMVLLSHRYVHVFRHEAQRMSSGMRVRGFQKHTDIDTLRAVSHFLGMLLVRSYERTERVFDAMRARGYVGRFPEPAVLRSSRKDYGFSLIWALIGMMLLFFDRTG